MDSGAFRVNRETFSLAYILAGAIKDAKMQSYFNSARVTITYQPDDMFVYADKGKITQVITNLITNAIKFTDEGTISITTHRNMDDMVAEVSIKDTGTGIDPEIVPRLFEKFATKSEKGTGIGLYISKRIVEAHGGIISGQNNADGRGAEFRFTVPLTKEEAERIKLSHPVHDSDNSGHHQ
jgi:two-component system sensor histidine kinase VicK